MSPPKHASTPKHIASQYSRTELAKKFKNFMRLSPKHHLLSHMCVSPRLVDPERAEKDFARFARTLSPRYNSSGRQRTVQQPPMLDVGAALHHGQQTVLESDTRMWGRRRVVDIGAKKKKGAAIAKYIFELSSSEVTNTALTEALCELSKTSSKFSLQRMVETVFGPETEGVKVSFDRIVKAYVGSTRVSVVLNALLSYCQPTESLSALELTIERWWHELDPNNTGEILTLDLARKIHTLGFVNSVNEALGIVGRSQVSTKLTLYEFFDHALLLFVMKGIDNQQLNPQNWTPSLKLQLATGKRQKFVRKCGIWHDGPTKTPIKSATEKLLRPVKPLTLRQQRQKTEDAYFKQFDRQLQAVCLTERAHS